MIIPRLIKDAVKDQLLDSRKVIILYGPRQAGKTTLSRMILDESGQRFLSINADQQKYIDVLSSRDLKQIQSLVAGYDLLFIDEGQRVPEIGMNLKIIHDEIPELKVLVTGSSSFLLSGRISEALTGRKRVFTLLPVSIGELSHNLNEFELNDQLNERLVFGCYPEVLTTLSNKEREDYLREVTTAYLYKDILELETIRYPQRIRDLLRLLAFQVGSQVSIHELCNSLKLNRETVERYIYLLEQSFIIFRLNAFSNNPRKEISKSAKYYFYDNGIRNTIIDNLNNIEARNDIGQLWENYIISERIKKHLFEGTSVNSYFWRNYTGAELNLIEEQHAALSAFEIKHQKARKQPPKAWSDQYGQNYHCVTKENYLEFLV